MVQKFPEICVESPMNGRYHVAVHEAVIKSGLAPVELQIGGYQMEIPIECLAYGSERNVIHGWISETWFPPGYVSTKSLYSQGTHSTHLDSSQAGPMYLRTENLRAVHIALESNDSDTYDVKDDRHGTTGPSRRREIDDFCRTLKHASSLEELSLSQNMEFFFWHARTFDACSRDLFMAIADKTYADGTPIDLLQTVSLMPKLKVLHLSSLQIHFETLLRFCRDRKGTLQEIRILAILDREVRCNAEKRIRDAVGARPNSDFQVELTDCYYKPANA